MPYLELNDENFNELILENEKAALVFFVSNNTNLSKDVKFFDRVLKEISGPL